MNTDEPHRQPWVDFVDRADCARQRRIHIVKQTIVGNFFNDCSVAQFIPQGKKLELQIEF